MSTRERSRHHSRSLQATGLVALARSLAVVSFDAVTMLLCALILWMSAGQTVVEGSSYGTVLCIVTAAVGLSVRTLIGYRSPSTPGRAAATDKHPRLILGLHLVAVTGAVVVWKITADYFWGWVACFASVFLLTGSLWRFLAAVLNHRHDSTARAGRSPEPLSFALAQLGGALAGILFVILTAPIHDWKIQIISSLIVMNTVSVLIAALAVRLFAAPKSPRERASRQEHTAAPNACAADTVKEDQ